MHGLHVGQHVLVALLLLRLQTRRLGHRLHGRLGEPLDGGVLAVLVLLLGQWVRGQGDVAPEREVVPQRGGVLPQKYLMSVTKNI